MFGRSCHRSSGTITLYGSLEPGIIRVPLAEDFSYTLTHFPPYSYYLPNRSYLSNTVMVLIAMCSLIRDFRRPLADYFTLITDPHQFSRSCISSTLLCFPNTFLLFVFLKSYCLCNIKEWLIYDLEFNKAFIYLFWFLKRSKHLGGKTVHSIQLR